MPGSAGAGEDGARGVGSVVPGDELGVGGRVDVDVVSVVVRGGAGVVGAVVGAVVVGAVVVGAAGVVGAGSVVGAGAVDGVDDAGAFVDAPVSLDWGRLGTAEAAGATATNAAVTPSARAAVSRRRAVPADRLIGPPACPAWPAMVIPLIRTVERAGHSKRQRICAHLSFVRRVPIGFDQRTTSSLMIVALPGRRVRRTEGPVLDDSVDVVAAAAAARPES